MRLTTSRETEADHAPSSWQSVVVASAGLVLMLCLVFALDMATASAPVQHLYYVPIILAGLRFGIPGGLATSLAAIVLYHAANTRLLILQYQHLDVVQIALFIAVGLVTAKLVTDRLRLNVLATTDDLTGLHNLRSFETRVVALVRASREREAPLAVLVLDVDRLKALNDVHGHLVGAEAVRAIGRIIGVSIPASGVACRYGGDEFVIAIPDCADADGRVLGDNLRCAVQSLAPVLGGVSFPASTLSISVGVACQVFRGPAKSHSDEELAEDLFREADRALYHAKELGRNAVHAA